MKQLFQRALPAALALSLLVPSVVFAHATVTPKEVGIGKFQTFSVSVPVEKAMATTAIRLSLPEGLEHVTPTVKPGWNIQTKHAEVNTANMPAAADHAEEGPITEITWTGGNIPQGQRDDFSFSAKAPAAATTLSWKIYQTYADGTVVSWELGPNDAQPQKDGKPDFSTKGPASQTKVIDDLAAAAPTPQPAAEKNNTATIALVLSIVAIAVSFMRFRKSAA